MPRYRFSWRAFENETVIGLAAAMGCESRDPDECRQFLDERHKRPTPVMVKAHKDALLEHWVARHEGTARALYLRVRDAGLGPIDYAPRSAKGYRKWLGRVQNRKRFRGFIVEALNRFGDMDRPQDKDPDHSFLPRFQILETGEVPLDSRRPFPYQEAAWTSLRRELAADGPFQGLLVMPTGAGKTFTSVRWVTENILAKGGRVLWLAHRHELLRHAALEFQRVAGLAAPRERLRMRIVSGQASATTSIDPEDDIVVASIASLARRPAIRQRLTADPRLFVVVDEAHHAPSKSYRDLLSDLAQQSNFRVLGLTATPTRTLAKERPELSRLFGGKILHRVEQRDLIEQGTLARPHLVRVETQARVEEGVSARDMLHLQQFQDLSPEWLDRIAHLAQRNHAILEHYVEHRERYGRTLIFAINVNHAALMARLMKEAGIAAEYIASHRPDGSSGDPNELIASFREGELDVLINVQMVTEGVDVPGIQTVFLSRPTSSEILVRQMIGRALRGPEAGGTDKAYVVSFEDHWERFREWESPLDLVPDIEAYAVQVTDGDEEAPPVLPPPDDEDDSDGQPGKNPVPFELRATVQAELRRLGHVAPTEVYEAIPVGWYVFEHDGEDGGLVPVDEPEPIEVEDEGDEVGRDPLPAERRLVAVYGHQQPFWEIVLDHLWSNEPEEVAEWRQEDLLPDLTECGPPKPSARDLELALRTRAFGGERPALTSTKEREVSDPAALARRIREEDLRQSEIEALEEAAFTPLARSIFKTRAAFSEAIRRQQHIQRYPMDATRPPPAIPLFDISEDLPFKPEPGTHDLQVLMADVLAAAPGLLGLDDVHHAGEVAFSKRIVKSWFGVAYYDRRSNAPGEGRIIINRLLDSPEVPEEVLRWLLWHEFLHLHLQIGHREPFRTLERRWPSIVESERFVDTLQNRFAVQWW